MASQSSIIACGTRMMILSMGLRFIIGPALIAITSYAIGMRATLLKVAIVQVHSLHNTCSSCQMTIRQIYLSRSTFLRKRIINIPEDIQACICTHIKVHILYYLLLGKICDFMQAALPQGIVPFVFAKEYGVHPDILSTG